MSALIVSAVVIAVLVVVLRGKRRRSRGSDTSREPARSDDVDAEATGYVPGVWMLGGAESAAPGHSHHHGADVGGAHAADAGSGDAGGGDAGGGDGGGGH
jgi:hypothetical protein